jgi:hypothetical protein
MEKTVYDESEDEKDSLKDKLETLLWVWWELSLSMVALFFGVVSYE